RELALDELIERRIQAGVPVLGICLGMQLLFQSSVENEGASGLSLLGGVVAPLEANGYKVPHIGWSPVRWAHGSRLTEGLGEETAGCTLSTWTAHARGSPSTWSMCDASWPRSTSRSSSGEAYGTRRRWRRPSRRAPRGLCSGLRRSAIPKWRPRSPRRMGIES